MEKIQSFSIRKFSIGVGSIVLTSTLLTSGHALADEASPSSPQSNNVSEASIQQAINRINQLSHLTPEDRQYFTQLLISYLGNKEKILAEAQQRNSQLANEARDAKPKADAQPENDANQAKIQNAINQINQLKYLDDEDREQCIAVIKQFPEQIDQIIAQAQGVNLSLKKIHFGDQIRNLLHLSKPQRDAFLSRLEENPDQAEAILSEAQALSQKNVQEQEKPKQDLPQKEKESHVTPKKPATHIVKPGDTVQEIAKKAGTTVEKIKQENHMTNPNLILPGERIALPAEKHSSETSTIKALPQTGENESLFGTTLLGGLSIALGGYLVSRQRKSN
ncbi:LysM peptidoglycan-binding domain-containing protein [Staphylococcus coagulans]|uniref:LysM peptidoglycan-binding domain-containing protein n=1 Tax=Staphylococcus coagulans TaxID=74706 RepID=UPI0015F8CAC6|nr:LysM peptidoglycan-binding domain-containing protein [Staphylococcus coagulans]MBA8762622.1 LysM peptidoglycan-binding domain-containing protein [Staphylococcus coagulans]